MSYFNNKNKLCNKLQQHQQNNQLLIDLHQVNHKEQENKYNLNKKLKYKLLMKRIMKKNKMMIFNKHKKCFNL